MDTMDWFSVLLSVYVSRQSASPVSSWLLTADIAHTHTPTHTETTHTQEHTPFWLSGLNLMYTHAPALLSVTCQCIMSNIGCRHCMNEWVNESINQWMMKKRQTENVCMSVCKKAAMNETINELLMTLFKDDVLIVVVTSVV